MPAPYYLTLRHLAESNRRALAEGTLLADVAQALSRKSRSSPGAAAPGYRRSLFGQDCHCAVGCALPPDVIDLLGPASQRCMVHGLPEIVTCEDLSLTANLQRAHDNWLQRDECGGDRAAYIEALDAVEAAAASGAA